MLTNFTYTFSNNQSGFTLQVVRHYIYAHKSYWDYDTFHLGCVVASAARLLLLCDFYRCSDLLQTTQSDAGIAEGKQICVWPTCK